MNRAGVVLGVDDGHRGAGQTGEILGPADVGQGIVVLEVMFEGDRIGHLAALHELQDGIVDTAVNGLVELFGEQEAGDDMDFFVVDEEGAEKRLLGLVVMGKRAKRDVLFPLIRHLFHALIPPEKNEREGNTHPGGPSPSTTVDN